MDALIAIKTRRSVREYREGEIAKETLEQILSAAMMAPSACNQQVWQFLVVTDKELLKKIPSIHPNAGMSAGASAGVLICGEPNKETCPGNWPVDCAAATQNLLLAVHALGLGAVWTAVYADEKKINRFRDFFNLPESIVPFSWVPIGYPAVIPESPDRYNPKIVHWNKW